MGDRVRIVRRIVVDDYVGTREGAKCQRLYEFTGVAAHGHAHVTADTLQTAKDLDCLVSRDTAGHSDRDFVCLDLAVHDR